MKVTNNQGRTFLVRIVQEGNRYGRDDCIIYDATHDTLFRKDDPMIEFYDLTVDLAKFGERGQFVSRYYASTLAEGDHTRGLCLDGGVPEWQIDAEAMAPVRRLAAALAPRR